MENSLVTICTPPPTSLDGVKYATAEGERKPIKLEVPGSLKNQKVRYFIIDDLLKYIDEDVYQWILSAANIIGSNSVQILLPDSSSGWAAQKDVTPSAGAPKVTLEHAPTTWTKQSVPGLEHAYT